MKFAIVLLAAVTGAFAQGPPASVQITAPTFRIIAGEQLRLKATVRDVQGLERPLDIATWSVDNLNVASITTNGDLTSRTLGLVRVTARMNNVSSTLLIQVLPKRVTLTPNTATLTVGQQMQFRATAYNKDDQPLTNVTFRYFTSSGNGFTTNTSSINASGMLNTVATGNILVRASFDYNTSVPGFERQAQAVATVSIRPPKSYELTKVLSTGDMRGPFRLRARIQPLLGNDRGQVVFNSLLDGTSNGPLLFDGSGSALLGAGGMPGPLPQTSIIEFTQLALNNRGEVLALSTVLFSGTTVFKLSRENGMEPLFIDSMPLPGTEFLSSPFLNRNCLNDSGEWMFRANYRVANQGATYTALFRNPQRGFPDEIVSTRSTLDGLASPFTLDNDFGLGGNGTAFFVATSAGRRALFVSNYGDPPRKVLAYGDPLLGSTVRAFYGNGFTLNENGELGVAVQLANNNIFLLRYNANNVDAAPRSFQLRSFGNLFRISPEAGALFLGDAGRGYGVYLWKDGDPVAVFLQNNNISRLRDKTVPTLDWATVSAASEVTIMARTQDHPMEIFSLRPGEPAVELMKDGDPVDVRAPVSISNILTGDRTGPVHVLLGGRNSSIFEAAGWGLSPVLLMGERFQGSSLWGGSSTGQDRKNANGDIFVSQTSGMGIMRIRNGNVEVVQRSTPTLATGLTGGNPANVTSNARGDLLWQTSTNRGDTRLLLTRGGEHTTLVTNGTVAEFRTEVDGKVVNAWADQQVDETGRVMATLRFTNGTSGLYLWEDGTWKAVAIPGESRHNNIVVASYSNVRFAGDTFYAIFNLLGVGNTLVKYKTGAWESAITVQETLVTGHLANSIGAYDVNRNGDIVAQCNTNTQVIVVKRGSKYHYIHMLSELTADGDLLTRTGDFDIRDDGTVYFLAMNVLDEYALYQAKPVN